MLLLILVICLNINKYKFVNKCMILEKKLDGQILYISSVVYFLSDINNRRDHDTNTHHRSPTVEESMMQIRIAGHDSVN